MSGLQRCIFLGLQILILLNAVTAADVSSSGNGKWHHPMHIKGENANLSPQIIGGSQAAAGMFPWHAWLDIQQIGSVGGYLCGASLIAAKYAMSACHCIQSTSKFKHDIVLGTINKNTPTAGYVRKTVAAPICHESYVSSTAQNDISLLPFDSPVTPTGNIQWINLPQPSLANLVGTRANVSGFGRISDSTNTLSTTLKYATLTITTDASCTAEYGASWYYSDVMMCAKAPAADQADCNGDSGGALVYNNGSAWVQIGIVSWGGTSCQTTSSVYARLSGLVSWVTNKMNSLDGIVDTTTTTATATTTAASATTTTTKSPTTTTTKPLTTTTTRTTTTAKTTTTKKPTTTKAPTTPKPPQCASKDFKNMLTKCCSPPAKDLLAKTYNKAIETTCKKVGGDNSVFNSFVLNKLQNIKKNNSVDLNDVTTLTKLLGKAACYIQCYLNQSGAIDSTGAINVDVLTALLIANQDPAGPWIDIITEAVSNCTSLISELPLPHLTSGKIKCDPTGALVVQCVLATIIDQCPSRVTSSTCKSDYALYDQCKNFVIDALMNISAKK